MEERQEKIHSFTQKPHVAILSTMLEISYLLDTGEISGRRLNEEAMSKFGLKRNFILSVKGNDLEDCVRKLKKKIQDWRDDEEKENVEQ